MAFCGKCGTSVDDNMEYCPSCGAKTDNVSGQQTQAQTKDLGSVLENINNTADTTDQYEQQDIIQNKAMAILAYFGPLVLISIFAAPKTSKFTRYHANQGLVLLLCEIGFSILYNILSAILLAISWRLYFIVSIIGIISIVFVILAIIGIINASSGKAKSLPIIGNIRILK